MADAAAPVVELLIFDLDGTLLDTGGLKMSVMYIVIIILSGCIRYPSAERVIQDVCKEVIEGEFQTPYPEQAKNVGLGKRPIEACKDLIDYLSLPCDPKELMDKTSPLLETKWAKVAMLPGALRLMQHLKKHNVRMALATSSGRSSLTQKLRSHSSSWVRDLEVIVSGDDVENGERQEGC